MPSYSYQPGKSYTFSAYPEEELKEARRISRRIKEGPQAETAFSGIINRATQAFAPAIKTGFKNLDEAVRFSPGRLIILGARPGDGKTTLATQISAQILEANDSGIVLYVSVEMEAAEIGLKALSCMTQHNCIDPLELADIEGIEYVTTLAIGRQRTLGRLHVHYGCKLEDILHLARRLHRGDEGPILLLVVDFITSIQTDKDYPTKAESVGVVSREMKVLAKELAIPVLVCAQLNRGTQPGRRPMMSNLKDSGNIEQDADVVLLLHNPVNKEGITMGKTELLVDKNRFGTMADLFFRPQLHHHRFEEAIPPVL